MNLLGSQNYLWFFVVKDRISKIYGQFFLKQEKHYTTILVTELLDSCNINVPVDWIDLFFFNDDQNYWQRRWN